MGVGSRALLVYWQQEGRAAQPLRKPVCMDSFSSQRGKTTETTTGSLLLRDSGGEDQTEEHKDAYSANQCPMTLKHSYAYAIVCMPKLPYCTNTKSNPNVEVICVGMWLVTQVPPWCHTIVGTVSRWKLNFGSEKKSWEWRRTWCKQTFNKKPTLFLKCHTHTHTCAGCGDQKTNLQSWFSPAVYGTLGQNSGCHACA